MKTFLAGIWSLIVALAASYAVAHVSAKAPDGQQATKPPSLQVEKTRVINVPMIANGAIRGFVVAQFGYTIDSTKVKSLPASPEIFLVDEAFRAIYTDDHIDFLHLNKYDITRLTTNLVAATNRRLGVEVVHDVLVQDFTFISKEENER